MSFPHSFPIAKLPRPLLVLARALEGRISDWLGKEQGMGAYVEGLAGKEESMVCVMARQGRQSQRYTKTGGRLIVGCVPYRFRMGKSLDDGLHQAVEVLVISSQKGHGMMFPKGGWEIDETREQAASREAIEEAGVRGNVESGLGKWTYKSKRYDIVYEATMFPLNVTELLEQWPEKNARIRRWVSVEAAMEGCQHLWMKEALDKLLKRLSSSRGIMHI